MSQSYKKKLTVINNTSVLITDNKKDIKKISIIWNLEKVSTLFGISS